jgi:hypothetical protein
MHNPGITNGNQSGLAQEQDIQTSTYSEDFMNIDDNLFGLDSEGRDLIFGMSCPTIYQFELNTRAF